MNRHERKLKQFYKEIAKWVKDGCPKHKSFKKYYGLCSNLTTWLHNLPWYQRWLYDAEYIQRYQENMFYGVYGTAAFPFGSEAYSEERLQGSHYQNEARLAFIFTQAGEKYEK